MKSIIAIMNMVRKLRTMGVLAGSFSKFTLKYFSLAAIMFVKNIFKDSG